MYKDVHSEAARMPLVLCSNKFALQTCSSRMCKDVHSWARMPLVLNSSDVFCLQKTRVQELTRMSSSEPPWMAVVPLSSKFFVRKTCRWAMYNEVHCSTALGIAAIAFLPLRHRRRSLWSVCGINNPDASVGVCCSHKVVAVGFNTLCYDASVGVLNPPHE